MEKTIGRTRLTIEVGDITKHKADALVNEALDEESRRHIGGKNLKL